MFTYIGKIFKKAFFKKSQHKKQEPTFKRGTKDLDTTPSPRGHFVQGNRQAKKPDDITRKKKNISKSLPSSSDGIRTQIKDEGYLEEKDLVIGFDFGTSCTKIIVQDVVIRTCYAISFEEIAIDKQGYFVPSQVFINDEGIFTLESSAHLLRDLKVELMDTPDKIIYEGLAVKLTAVDATVAFIALILKRTIINFLNKYQDVYKNTNIIWQLNIGLPSRSYDDRSMCETFKLVALAGWRAAVLYKEVTTSSVKDSVKNSRVDLKASDKVNAPVMHPDYVDTIPEVISEVIGYARSPLRNEGLHLLLDIGASTFDVSTFILHSPEGEDCYTICTAEVELFGCLKLHRQRIFMANEIVDTELMKIDRFLNGMTPLPKIEDYFNKNTHGLANIVREIRDKVDVPFFKKCKQRIYSVVLNTKNEILPLSTYWQKGMPVFICGGGSNNSEYRKLIEECDLVAFGIPRFRVIELPKPEGLEASGLYSDNYHRMAVAYGLSFSTDDIKEIIPPHVVAEDIIAERHENEQIRLNNRNQKNYGFHD
jgi:hypothetical protein